MLRLNLRHQPCAPHLLGIMPCGVLALPADGGRLPSEAQPVLGFLHLASTSMSL